MPQIVATELKVFRAANHNDLSTNGGRMSATEIVGDVNANVFGNVEETERTAGSTKYRKLFFKVHHDENDKPLLDGKVFQWTNTDGDDRVTFFPATQTDTQSSITGTERQYGCGKLNTTVAAGVSSIQVLVETDASGLFQAGDTIRISDKPTLGGAGNEELVAVSGTPTQVGSVVTIALATPLAAGYSSANTMVSSVYTYGTVQPMYTGFTVTSGASGTCTPSGNLLLNNIGTIEQTWTLTFTSATAFNISGNTVGAIGSGTVSGGAAPSNTDWAKPYFTLGSAAFGGTFQAGDTISFVTHPAAIPVWQKRVVPAGAGITGVSNAQTAMIGGTT